MGRRCVPMAGSCGQSSSRSGARVDAKRPSEMKLASVNVGLPREVMWHGINVTTGIFKEQVEGRVRLRKLNLDADSQCHLTVHGGKDKAVYCYPLVHYDYWKKELPGWELPAA